jgi:hypothetical protein
MSKATKNTVKTVKATKVDGIVKKAVDGQNPFRIGGGYWASIQALRAAGQGKMHAFDVLVPLVKKAMGDGYKAFAAKDARNDATGKDAEARIIQNISVTARKDYGQPLVENGLHVVFDGRNKTAGLFKVGQEPKAVEKAATVKPEPKTAKKATKAKAKPKAAKKAK